MSKLKTSRKPTSSSLPPICSRATVCLENLHLLAGVAGELPARDGCHFIQLEKTLKGQVDRLQDEGYSAVIKEIKVEVSKRS